MKFLSNVAYSDFCLKLQDKSCGRPLCAQIAVTFNCNLSCVYCYLGSFRNASGSKEMDHAFLKDLLDQLADSGIIWLSFTGGEPLLRKDFKRIYVYAKRKGFITTILTNATLIDEKWIGIFKEYPPFCLDIPINAVEPRLYDRLSAARGAWTKFSGAIDLLCKNNISFRLKATVMAPNLNQVERIRKFASDLGVPFNLSPIVYPCLDRSSGPLSLRISPRQAARFFMDEDSEGYCEKLPLPTVAGLNLRKLFRCSTARFSVFIDPFGCLSGCDCLSNMPIDLKTTTFESGLSCLLSEIPSLEFKTESQCVSCKIRDVCLICPGIAYLETGNEENPVDYFCCLARTRDEQRKKYLIKDC